MMFPDLHPSLLRALTKREYTEPTPVQLAVLAPEAAECDLLVSAPTGSGKTVAYGMTLAKTLLGDAERFERAQQPLALIIAPTRELAQQVQRELEWLFADAGARVVSCVGGMDIRREQRLLSQGAHIVVGTPGRLADHLDQRHLYLSAVRAVVLDEADEMLDLGFRDELEILLNATPPERRTLLFSATLPKPILTLARRYQKNALRLALSSETEPHADIEYRVYSIRPRDTEHAVVNSLRYIDAHGALVFCHTREAVRHLHANLQERGFSAVALSGELKQHERNSALQALRDGRARVCVATDVAARGLDMPDVGLVIHADLPQNRQILLHRSGRTGRAGRKGLSLLLAPAQQRGTVERLLASAKIKAIWSPAPTADMIRARDQENLVRDIATMAEAPAEEDLAVGRLLLAERSAENIAAVLVRLQREHLPAPEVLDDPGSMRSETWKSQKGPAGKAVPFKKKTWGKKKDFKSHPPKSDFKSRPKTDFGSGPKTEYKARPKTEFGSGPTTDFKSRPKTSFKSDFKARPKTKRF
jgi:ATP-dependent RNA helicase DeaD